ncbi:MAG: ATP-binding protein [Elusimicrobia bacterium]|nr:ATP-binding protein [Elusimicrobiota bacterium]
MPAFRRPLFAAVAAAMRSGKVQILAGPRQTGKTTILKQLAADLLSQGVAPARILYLPLDDFEDELSKGEMSLRAIIETFSEEIARTPLASGEKFVFLDEAHVHPGWAREAKILHDQDLPVRLVVSGSAATDLLAAAATHLAGRSVEHVALPLAFGELLLARLEGADLHAAREAGARMSDAVVTALEGDTETLSKVRDRALKGLAGLGPRLRADLSAYLRRGGFPEQALKGMSDQDADSRLHGVLDQMIRRDFVNFFHVRDTKTLERLIRILAQNTGRILSERRLASDVGAAINTVRNHVGFLERTFVVFPVRALQASAAAQARLPEKFYFLDPGLRNSLAGYGHDDRGQLLESVVHSHLMALLRSRRPAAAIHYWRRGGDEVDLVAAEGPRLLGIEVHSSGTGLRGLRRFLDDNRGASGVLVSDAAPSAPAPGIVWIPPQVLLLAQA